VEGVNLRFQHGASLLEVRCSRRAVSLLVLENCQHGVASRIIRAKLEQMTKEWNGFFASSRVVDLCRSLQGGQIVGRDTQSALKGNESFLAATFARKGYPLQSPELGILGILLKRGLDQFAGLLEIVGPQR